MTPLNLHALHDAWKARFAETHNKEFVQSYDNPPKERSAISKTAALVDLSFRERLCLLGTDRKSFLHGQVTNNIRDLSPHAGCYAALVNAKGRIESDLNVYNLANELLLDFEPGLFDKVARRLDRFIIAEDVQILDASPHFGMLSLQGPQARQILLTAGIGLPPESASHSWTEAAYQEHHPIYTTRHARTGTDGYDLFAPNTALPSLAAGLKSLVEAAGGSLAGWDALDAARIEAGIPRFGVDMDDTNLAPETGMERTAISYNKGCYIGQEVIARIRTYGQVARALRTLLFNTPQNQLPARGSALMIDGRDVGAVTSVTWSESRNAAVGLGYVRREFNTPGTKLRTADATQSEVVVCGLPFPPAPTHP